MDKQMVLYSSNKMMFIDIKSMNTDTCNNINEHKNFTL